jgi:hypothetical protein
MKTSTNLLRKLRVQVPFRSSDGIQEVDLELANTIRLISHLILKSIVATIYAQLFGTILLCSDCVMAGGNRVIGGSYVPTYIQNVQVFYQPPT